MPRATKATTQARVQLDVTVHNGGLTREELEEIKNSSIILSRLDEIGVKAIRLVEESGSSPTSLHALSIAEEQTTEQKRKAIWEKTGISYWFNYNDQDLIVILGSCCFARREYEDWQVSFDGRQQRDGGMDWLKDYQPRQGFMYRCPTTLSEHEEHVKDSKGHPIGIYNKELKTMFLGFTLGFGSRETMKIMQKTEFLCRVISNYFGIYDESEVEDFYKEIEEKRKKEEEEKVFKAADYFVSRVFASRSALKEKRNSVASQQQEIERFQKEIEKYQASVKRLEQEISLLEVLEGQFSIDSPFIRQQIQEIQKISLVESIAPYIINGNVAGIKIRTKPLSLNRITATDTYADQVLFGEKAINLPPGKYEQGPYEFVICVDTSYNKIAVISSGTNNHPHVRSGGSMCQGAMIRNTIANASETGDLVMLVQMMLKYYQTMHAGDSIIKLPEYCTMRGWDMQQLLEDGTTDDGKNFGSLIKETPFAVLKPNLNRNDVFNNLSIGSLATHAKEPSEGGHGTYMQIVSEGENSENYVVRCSCGSRFIVGIAAFADLTDGKKAMEYYKKNKIPFSIVPNEQTRGES